MNELQPIVNSKRFRLVYEKLLLDEALSVNEASYLLSCAMIFFTEYLGDRRKKRLFDLGYYIVLKYSVQYSDYEPLYDVSVNFGLFPISSYIEEHQILNSINQFYVSYQSENYLRDGIYETFEQKESREKLLSLDGDDSVFVAPTSYGKSSFIIDVVKQFSGKNIAVIVPTKSLLAQTYRQLSSAVEEVKIIFHDEMYEDDIDFIGVLTQERALRLLNDNPISFDVIVVDEAHKLFERGHRSVLLTRLLRKNRKRKPKSKIYYLSPLIDDPENVKFSEVQTIDSYIISRSVKEPEVYEYKMDLSSYRYDKFCNEFHKINSYGSYMDYIVGNLNKKNFFYHKRPINVQYFSKDLYDSLPEIGGSLGLDEISSTIAKNVHSDFYCVEYVKKGIVYLHGKLPDILKEYMEEKFKVSEDLRFMVANSVVLEGINFPVDNLFVMNTHGLGAKDLVNLIGRVNRLNMVFKEEGHSLSKLMPQVHFVNSEKYEKEKSKMENKIRLLRKKAFPDVIGNPTLLAYSGGASSGDLEGEGEIEDGKPDVGEYIKEIENFLVDNDGEEEGSLRVAFFETGINSIYKDPDRALEIVSSKILEFSSGAVVTDVVDIIYYILIDGQEENIKDKVFLRLRNESARKFYKMFIDKCHRFNLKELIDDFVSYYLRNKYNPKKRLLFVGTSFGEDAKQKSDGSFSPREFIDLAKKSKKDLVNLALVKIKIENDFVSYTLNECVKFLYLGEVLTKDTFEKFVYGSSNRIGSKLAQLGIGGALINKIDRDGMIAEVKVNEWGRIEMSERFSSYLKNQDDLFQFEIGKYLSA